MLFLPFVRGGYSFGGGCVLAGDGACKDVKVSLMSYNLPHARFLHTVQKYIYNKSMLAFMYLSIMLEMFSAASLEEEPRRSGTSVRSCRVLQVSAWLLSSFSHTSKTCMHARRIVNFELVASAMVANGALSLWATPQ